MKKIFIILPTYNEKDNLFSLVKEIFNLNIPDLHIIIVDDNSPDGTGQMADQLVLKYANLSVIHRQKKLGLGSAYIIGFKKALVEGANLFFEMDADFSHSPKDIPRFLTAVQEGYEVVIGSRRVAGGGIIGWGVIRKMMSRGAMWFSRLILRLRTRDVTSGFRCYSRKVIEKIDWEKIKSDGYAFQEETIYLCEKLGFQVKEIPIIFQDRLRGYSKLSRKEVINFFLTILRLRLGR